jgi:hypothetical protein
MTGMLAAVAAMGQGVTISITNKTITRSTISGTATATYTLDNDGNVRSHSGTVQEVWCSIFGVATAGPTANYEARATLQSGTINTGTFGSWLNLGTDRSWSNVNPNEDDSTISGTMLIEIRSTGGTVLDSATITISAQSGSGL